MIECNDHKICINKSISYAQEIFLKNKKFLSPLRCKTLEIIWHSHQPMGVKEIKEALKKEDYDVQSISIYRILDILINFKLIHKIHSLNAYIGCPHPLDKHLCSFLICNKCNSIEELCSNKIVELINNESEIKNFNLKGFSLEISGLCSKCANYK